MKEIFELEKATEIDPAQSYIVSYPHLAGFSSRIENFTATDFVALSHMVYGWMPRVLTLHTSENNIALETAAGLLNKAREEGILSYEELSQLSAVVNNSIVGASKLLHFVAPDHFPIWDSRIYRFLHDDTPHPYRVNSVDQYQTYLELLKNLKKDQCFPAFHLNVNNKLGYEVSPLRALELVMFLNSSE